MKIHELKTWPQPFLATHDGVKTFEFRKNDRDFKKGDVLHLLEFKPESSTLTGKALLFEVIYILHGPNFGIPDGFCIMSIVPSLP